MADPFHPLKPGAAPGSVELSASELARQAATVQAHDNILAVGGFHQTVSAIGPQFADAWPKSIWLKVTGAPTGRAYPWTEQQEDGSGNFSNWTEARSGTAAALPSYEVSGRTDVPAGTIVRAWLSIDWETSYLFWWLPATLGGGFTFTGNVTFTGTTVSFGNSSSPGTTVNFYGPTINLGSTSPAAPVTLTFVSGSLAFPSTSTVGATPAAYLTLNVLTASQPASPTWTPPGPGVLVCAGPLLYQSKPGSPPTWNPPFVPTLIPVSPAPPPQVPVYNPTTTTNVLPNVVQVPNVPGTPLTGPLVTLDPVNTPAGPGQVFVTPVGTPTKPVFVVTDQTPAPVFMVDPRPTPTGTPPVTVAIVPPPSVTTPAFIVTVPNTPGTSVFIIDPRPTPTTTPAATVVIIPPTSITTPTLIVTTPGTTTTAVAIDPRPGQPLVALTTPNNPSQPALLIGVVGTATGTLVAIGPAGGSPNITVTPNYGLVLTPGTTAEAPLNLPDGVAPTSPESGDIWNDGTDLLASVGGTTLNLTHPAASSGTPAWVKVTKTKTDFSTAGTTRTITGYAVPAKGIVHNVVLKHSAAFTGGAIATYQIEVILNGNTVITLNTFQAPGNTVFGAYLDTALYTNTPTTFAGWNVELKATSSGANLNAATTGSCDLWVLTSTLP